MESAEHIHRMNRAGENSAAVDESVNLFSPLRIGTITIRNRIMQTAHSKLFSPAGHESERDIAYFARRAAGGAGLLVAGNRFIHPSSSIPGFCDAFRTDTIHHDRKLLEAVHARGAKLFVQLNHHGAQASANSQYGPRPALSASNIVSPNTGTVASSLTRAQIATLTESWAMSAANAQAAGFDGVEIHIAHSYLLHQFLSPLYNFRTDDYGGGLEGRARFASEVIRAVRARVGDGYTLGIRIVANEFLPNGLTNADIIEAIELLELAGRIDFIDLAGGGYHNLHYVFPPAAIPATWLREDVRAIKARNPQTPVFGVGTAESVEAADDVITSGLADVVAMTRAQIADPDLARKLETKAHDTITHCIRLNQGCLARTMNGLPMSCTVNPLVGREADRHNPTQVPLQQRWAVVGGGPAGMKAAETLALNGHAVTLFEESDALGGQLRLAAQAPGRGSIMHLIEDLTRSINRAGVAVRLHHHVTASVLESMNVDGVVLATGARPSVIGDPVVAPVLYSATSLDAAEILDPEQAMQSPARVSARTAVIDGDGTRYSASVVTTLLHRGHHVHLFTVAETVFPQIQDTADRHLLIDELYQHDFVASTNTIVRSATSNMIRAVHRPSGKRQRWALGSLILATPRVPNLLAPSRNCPPVASVGDCVAPRTIDAAIFEGFEVGYAAGRYQPGA